MEAQEFFLAQLPLFEDARLGAVTARSRENLAIWFGYQNRSSRAQEYAEVDGRQRAHMPYRDECEFRLVLWGVHQRNENYPKVPYGAPVKVNIKILIQCIVRSLYPGPLEPELERFIEVPRTELRLLRTSRKGKIRLNPPLEWTRSPTQTLFKID